MPHIWDANWTTHERLGKGGQGTTLRATYRENSAIIGALKYLNNNKSQQARGRMRCEVASLEVLADLGGAVPRVLDHNTGDFQDTNIELYVVMDFIPGQTLSDVVKSGPLTVDEVVRIGLALCKTVALAHSHPILHRDMKPDNIIVRDTSKADLVVVDYGLSFNSQDSGLTKFDETFSNRFLSLPETNIPGGDLRDPRSDVTAVCGILYFCLTSFPPGHLLDGHGRPPHRRPGFGIDQIKDDRLPILYDFFDRGLTTNIANRFQTVDELQESLGGLLTSEAIDETDPIQLASKLSADIRKIDRKTQLAEFAQHGAELFNFIRNDSGKYVNRLGRFKIQVGGLGFFAAPISGEHELSPGLNRVEVNQPCFIKLGLQNHDIEWVLKFGIAARGEQCVLLAGEIYIKNKEHLQQIMRVRPTDQRTIPATEWLSYDGNPEPAFQLVSMKLREWINAKMKSLSEEISSAE